MISSSFPEHTKALSFNHFLSIILWPLEYSVRLMQLFRAFSAGLSEIRCSDSGLPWKRIPSANKSQQLISSQIWICRIMTAWHIRSFPGSVMMGETPWPSKSSQTPWYSLQRGSTTAGIKLTRFHYD